jgi:hypothetical protein
MRKGRFAWAYALPSQCLRKRLGLAATCSARDIALQNKYTHVASSGEMVLLELSRRNQLIYRFHQFWEFATDRAVVVVTK